MLRSDSDSKSTTRSILGEFHSLQVPKEMKIHVELLNGFTADIKLNYHATIGELRSNIGRARLKNNYNADDLEAFIDGFGRIALEDDAKNVCTIYRDDPADAILIAFLKEKQPDFNYEVIKAIVVLNLGPYGTYRPTKHNPLGVPVWALESKQKETRFFQSIFHPKSSTSFSARLAAIKFSGIIPDKFLDPITHELMNNPMLTSDMRTYDRETIIKLNHISPFTKKPFRRGISENLLLRSQLEDFVAAQEQLALNNNLLTLHVIPG